MSYFSFSLLLEILLLCLFPWPFYDKVIHLEDEYEGDKIVTYKQFMSDFFLASMIFRLFFIYRSVLNYSLYTDAFSKKLCQKFGFPNNLSFALKCLFKLYPTWTAFINFIVSVLGYAYLVRIFENPVAKQTNIDNFFTAMYTTVITITTVGYGDSYPITTFGKVTMMLSSLQGALMISLLVLTVSSNFELTENQAIVFRRIQSSKTACDTIIKALKFYRAKKAYYIYRIKTESDLIETSTPFLELAKEKKTWYKYTDPNFEKYFLKEMERSNVRADSDREGTKLVLDMRAAYKNMMGMLEQFTRERQSLQYNSRDKSI